ncbi:MAG: CxxxxCH/CxxCH domain-containing protein, partial [Desulfuromonadales bacterium]
MGYISAQQTRYSHLISGFFLLAILLVSAGSATAGTVITACNDCHGMPPKDGTRKGNPHFRSYSSATVGSHQKHLAASSLPNDCVVCHGTVVSTFDHQNDVINMAAPISGGSYGKGVFFNLTSIPALGTTAKCSNVSCHADPYSAGTVTTPIWGTSAGCAACHTTPIGTNGPATGSHTTAVGHAVACTTCHAAGTTATTVPSTGHNNGNINV